MARPAQIRKQAEAVDKFYADMAKTEEGSDEDADGVADDAETSDEDTVPAGEDVTADSAPSEQAQDNTDNEALFEQKYRSLQGKYNVEIPRVNAENRDLKARVAELEQLMATMAKEPEAKQQDTPPSKLITEQDLEEYGDSIDVMRRVSREETAAAQARVSALEQQIEQMRASVVPQMQQLSQTQAATSERGFWVELQAAVPDWQEVNNDPDFQSWLLDTDPITGLQRQTHLDDAQRSFAADRVASIFNVWKQQNGKAEAQPDRGAAASSELERQIAPGRGRATGGKAAKQEPVVTREYISKFYDDVRRGVYTGDDAKRTQIERDIFTAQREGRIE